MLERRPWSQKQQGERGRWSQKPAVPNYDYYYPVSPDYVYYLPRSYFCFFYVYTWCHALIFLMCLSHATVVAVLLLLQR